MSMVIGHNIQRNRLARLLKQGTLSPSLLFAGKEGVGKQQVALELARSLICQNSSAEYGGCGTCHACQLFSHQGHPDVFFRDGKEKEESNAEAIRTLLHSLHLKSFHNSPRVVLLDNADHLNTTASNILLKELEEPGKDIYFFLICANPSRLPDTIISRCQKWFFHRLTNAELSEIFTRVPEVSQLVRESEFSEQELLDIAEGSLTTLQEMLGLKEDWIHFQKELEKIKAGDFVAALSLAEQIKSDKDSIPAFLSLLRLAGRKLGSTAKDFLDQNSWAVFVQNMINAEILISERNLAPAYVLETAFLQLIPEKQRSGLEAFPNGGKLLDRIIRL